MDNKKVAVMQPYIFPYLGYFQLVQAVDVFVFYDDVNFIKRGWINRNNILLNNKRKLISFPCLGISQHKEIRQIQVDSAGKDIDKIIRTIEMAYKKAPYFEEIFPIVRDVISFNHGNVAEFAAHSIIAVSEYLELKKEFLFSSVSHSDSKGMEKEARLISICEKEGADHYINSIGGMAIYDKKNFEAKKIELNFLKPSLTPYKQFEDVFVEGLSMIDVLMFNNRTEVKMLLKNYTLI